MAQHSQNQPNYTVLSQVCKRHPKTFTPYQIHVQSVLYYLKKTQNTSGLNNVKLPKQQQGLRWVEIQVLSTESNWTVQLVLTVPWRQSDTSSTQRNCNGPVKDEKWLGQTGNKTAVGDCGFKWEAGTMSIMLSFLQEMSLFFQCTLKNWYEYAHWFGMHFSQGNL